MGQEFKNILEGIGKTPLVRLVDEARVGLAPGSAFGAGGEQFLRLCFAAGTPRLAEAMDRLEPFFS